MAGKMPTNLLFHAKHQKILKKLPEKVVKKVDFHSNISIIVYKS